MTNRPVVRPFLEVVKHENGEDELILSLHAGQTAVNRSKARFPVMLGGTQAGKTVYTPHWLEREIRAKGPGDYLAITATFPLLNLKLLSEMQLVFETLLHYADYSKSDKVLYFHQKKKQLNDKVLFPDSDVQTRIIFGSATNPESIESATAKAAILDECVAPETLIDTEIGRLPIREIVKKRLRLRVWSYDTINDKWELVPILRWIKLPQRKPLLKLGRLRLTGNHKVWTKDGYILAEELITSAQYDILRAEVVKDGKGRVQTFGRDSQEDEGIRQEENGRTRCEGFCQPQETFSRTSRTQKGPFNTAAIKVFKSEKSSMGAGWRRVSRTYGYFSQSGFTADKAERIMEIRGEWQAEKLETGETRSSLRMGERICGDNGTGMVASRLQNRCGGARIEDSYRSWQSSKSPQAGMVSAKWVDISSLYKQYRGDLDGGCSSDTFVYNLEVEGNHNYVADGILVSNCGQRQFRRDAWEAVLRRLSLAQGRALITTTLYGYGWLKSEVFDEWLKGNKDFDVIQVDSIVNPAFPVEEYERARRTLPDWKFQLFYRGRYSKPAGMVYDCFDTACIVEPFSINGNWPVYCGHDFGSVNMAGIWIAQNPVNGYLFIFKEYIAGGKATWEHAQKWQEMSAGLRIVKRIGGAAHEDGWRGDFSQAGWRIDKPITRSVDEGIQRVYGFFKTNRIFIFRDCLNFLDEIQSYSYEMEDDGFTPSGKIADKERFHCLDSLRYALSDFIPVESAYGEVSESRWDDYFPDWGRGRSFE